MELVYKNSGQDIFIEADKGRITQVISNLISNAVKFTKVGTVTVGAEKVEENDCQQVIISIKDTRTGIDLKCCRSFLQSLLQNLILL